MPVIERSARRARAMTCHSGVLSPAASSTLERDGTPPERGLPSSSGFSRIESYRDSRSLKLFAGPEQGDRSLESEHARAKIGVIH